VQALILGSGGSQPTPKAGCTCRVCTRARLASASQHQRDPRGGPSLYLPQFGLLVDTPEESNQQLNAHNLLDIRAVLWSHFHPDHTAGLRIVEYLARWGAPGVPSFMPLDLEENLDQVSLFAFAKAMRHIEITSVADQVPFSFAGLSITMLRHSGKMPMYSFLFEHNGLRLLYNPDHFMTLETAGLNNLGRAADRAIDCAIVQVGLMPDGVQDFILPPDHPARKVLLPLETIVATAKALGWRQLIFSHLYEAIRLFPEQYDALAATLSAKHGLPVSFAHDGMALTLSASAQAVSRLTSSQLIERLRQQREAIGAQFRHDRVQMREEMRKLLQSPEQLELNRRG
jgi:phosphoribosyl 1,2-cyclic phosphate phosphodiesterase